MNNYLTILTAALTLSGCATPRVTSVEQLPNQPGMERVETRRCVYEKYNGPFTLTGHLLADPFRSDNDRFFFSVFTSLSLTPFALALDGIFMPVELFHMDPQCSRSVAYLPSKITAPKSYVDDLMPPPNAFRKDHDAVAVVVGVQNYRNKDVPPVEYALNDAAVVREYAVKAMGIRPENVILIQDASKGDLDRVFGTPGNPKGQLYDLVASGKSDVIVYYSGHGAPDVETRRAYLVPADGDPNYVKLNGYPIQLLFDNLNAIHARSATVILDACFSGGSASGPLLAKASPLAISTSRPFLGEVTLFASSEGNEISSWYPQKRHGLFTYFFLNALRGAASKSGGRQVSASEINSYLSLNVPLMARRLFGREQEPVFYGDLGRVLVRTSRGTAP